MHKLFSHTEAIIGYFFHIEADKYCYVGEYENQTLVHLRVYEKDETTGRLIPTKIGMVRSRVCRLYTCFLITIGAALRVHEWRKLKKVAAETLDVLNKKKTEENPKPSRRALGKSTAITSCGTVATYLIL